MKEYINSICTGELVLPITETNIAHQCEECYEHLALKSQALLEISRRKPANDQEESKLLSSLGCRRRFTITHKLDSVMEEGFQRLFGRGKLNQDEIIDLKWIGLPKRPATNGFSLEYQRWLLQVAAVQIDVNLHDWRHRSSCFKKRGGDCRYKLPREPVEDTMVKPIYSVAGSKTNLLYLNLL